eukprot:4910140-Amphidinium_carterae.1
MCECNCLINSGLMRSHAAHLFCSIQALHSKRLEVHFSALLLDYCCWHLSPLRAPQATDTAHGIRTVELLMRLKALT